MKAGTRRATWPLTALARANLRHQYARAASSACCRAGGGGGAAQGR